MILQAILSSLLILKSYGYIFGSTPLTAPAAQAWCESQGTNLATVKDDAARDATKLLCQQNKNSQYGCWIGGYTPDVGVTWLWRDGSPLGTYGFDANGDPTRSVNPWANGEPNSGGREDCIHIASHLGWGWNDASCTGHRMNPICDDPAEQYEVVDFTCQRRIGATTRSPSTKSTVSCQAGETLVSCMIDGYHNLQGT